MYVFTGASPIQKTVTENAGQPAPAKAPTDEGVFIKLIVSGGNLKEGKIFFDNFTLEEAQP